MSKNGIKENFLSANDNLGLLINSKANELFLKLNNFNVSSLDSDDTYNDYFIHHHLGKRLFFSIQNSAHILYGGIKMCNKPIHEINAIDYGAGLGTLFMLGGMLGCKRFDYNDHLPDWQQTASVVCKEAGISISDYITGDIKAVIDFAESKKMKYDLVVSRNVIEHIYSLPDFYSIVFNHNNRAVTYSTTTANFHNPVMRLYHIYIHKKAEKNYMQQRREEIKKLHPMLEPGRVNALVQLTRGKGQQDFINAVNDFVINKPIEKDNNLRSNTCDCTIGVWSEHLLKKNEYADIINKAGFKMEYIAGYWDTHYKSGMLNMMAKILNRLIIIMGKKSGIFLSPFVNVIAYN